MLRSLVCWGKSKMEDCYYTTIWSTSAEIKLAAQIIYNISNLQEVIDKCTNSCNIEEVLKFNADYVDNNYWSKAKNEEFSKEENFERYVGLTRRDCKLDNKECNEKVQSNKKALDKLVDEINIRIEKYNKDLTVIRKVQNYCYNHSGDIKHINENVYFRFARDKYNELIALYFNVEHFLRNYSEPVETIYVFSGEDEYPFNKHTMLHLKYENIHFCLDGIDYEKCKLNNYEISHAHICDFISNNKKRGHGTFILKNLEDIIRRVNKRFEELRAEDEDACFDMTIIKAINGEVVPDGTIKYDDLVKLYNKNGLTTYGRTFGDGTYLPNRVIYKELE